MVERKIGIVWCSSSDAVGNAIPKVIAATAEAPIKIKSILKQHGLQYEDNILNNYGGALRTIKDMRNSLAHGNISFEDNGRKLTVDDLERYKNKTFECIEYFIKIVNSSY